MCFQAQHFTIFRNQFVELEVFFGRLPSRGPDSGVRARETPAAAAGAAAARPPPVPARRRTVPPAGAATESDAAARLRRHGGPGPAGRVRVHPMITESELA